MNNLNLAVITFIWDLQDGIYCIFGIEPTNLTELRNCGQNFGRMSEALSVSIRKKLNDEL